MTDYALTPSIVPNQADWTLLDFTGIQQSIMSGAVRTISRGQRWQAHFTWENLITDDRHYLSALMALMRGKSNRLWINDPTYRKRGSFPSPELLANGQFKADVVGWSATAAATLSGSNRVMRLDTGGIAAAGAYQSVNLAAGAAYALRACLVDGPNSAGLTLGVQMSVNGAPTPNVSLARGLITVAALATSTATGNQFPISISAGGGLAAGQIVFCTYASLRRCALAVNPAAATFGTMLPVDALPVSTRGLLLAGDRVEINGEMKSVTFNLDSDAAGAGTLIFEPALRKVVPDNAPIIIGEPLMKGVMSVDGVQPSRPGVDLFSDFDFTFVEA